MVSGPDPIPSVLISAFVHGLAARNWRQSEACLDIDVIYRPPDAAPVHGRHHALARWKRMFNGYAALDIQITRQIAEGGLVIAQQMHTLLRPDQAPVQLENTAVYEIRNGLIVEWSDHMDLDETAPTEPPVGDGARVRR